MGLDGFSMGNLGLNVDVTSAQMTIQAEQIALKDSQIEIKDVTKSADGDGVKRKEEQSEENNFFDDGSERKEKNEDESEDAKGLLAGNGYDLKNPKDYSMRINFKTELIELYNNKSENIVETITSNDLMNVIKKMDNASGVLVNRKI